MIKAGWQSLRSPSIARTSPYIAAALVGIAPAAVAQELPLTLDTLVVVGTRVSPGLTQQTRAVELIDRDLLTALPVRSISDALAWAAGVDVLTRSAAQADLSIRGSSAEQVLVLVDGVPVNDRQTAHFDLDLAVPFDRIERIEVLRGPASAAYGTNAIGGVVNIVTRRPAALAEGRVEAGSFGTLTGSVGAGVGAGRRRVSAGGSTTRSDGHRDGTDFRRSVVHVTAEHELWRGMLAAQGGYVWKDFGAADFYAPFPSFEETRTGTVAVSWTGCLSRRVDLKPKLYYRRHKDHFVLDREDPGLYNNRHTSSQLGAETVVRYRAESGVNMAGGAAVARDLLESTNLGDRVENRWAVFAEAQTLRGPFTVNFGARADHYESYGLFVSPSISTAYQHGLLRVRGSLGRSFRAPTWTERYYEDPVNRGNPDLEPERAWTAELGADFAISGTLWVSLMAFRRMAGDLIDWARPEAGEGPWETRNVETATFRGIETEVSGIRVVGTNISLRASVLDVSADSVVGFVSKYALRPIVGDVSVALVRAFGIFRGATHLRYRQRESESGYWLWNLRVALPMWYGEMFVDLLNGLDVSYADVTGAPAAGRALLVGFRTRM